MVKTDLSALEALDSLSMENLLGDASVSGNEIGESRWQSPLTI